MGWDDHRSAVSKRGSGRQGSWPMVNRGGSSDGRGVVSGCDVGWWEGDRGRKTGVGSFGMGVGSRFVRGRDSGQRRTAGESLWGWPEEVLAGQVMALVPDQSATYYLRHVRPPTPAFIFYTDHPQGLSRSITSLPPTFTVQNTGNFPSDQSPHP
eukprot:750762-Hanusia_phi.AAC.2